MFHASRHSFEFPDYEKICSNRTGHENGDLGLWVANKSDWIDGFGGYVYEVDFEGVSKDLSIHELSKWACLTDGSAENSSFYRSKREEMITQGISFLRLVEDDGRSEMGIVLNFDSIKSFRQISAPQEIARERA